MDSDNQVLDRRKVLAGLGMVALGGITFESSGLQAQAKVQPYAEIPGKPSIILFDVNETLIDIDSIGPHFNASLVTRLWFATSSIDCSLSGAITLAGIYTTFFHSVRVYSR